MASAGGEMHIHEIWIRFYKSFNFDYELKAKPGAKVRAWQETPEGWMPHVRIPVEPDITAVVGANESGKSHLLDAIKIVLTGEDHLQRDFCRSSTLFSVEHGSRLYPEVGATFRIDDVDRALLQEHEIPLSSGGNLLMLRPRPEAVEVVDASDQRVELETEQIEALTSLLPYPYDLQTEIALPDSVSIAALSGDTTILAPRKSRGRLWTLFGMLKTEDDYKNEATNVLSLLTGDEPAKGPQQLGMDLLTKIAHIEESSFQELRDAISNEREGLVNGLIQEMNNSIARHLNVSKWWSQDPEFQLRVSPREHELVFTIRDRTGTDYSFSERSRGLRYFLSYYVQLLSHDRPEDRPELLLMDEPDAFLSASGQQDLLRVLEHHARPDDSEREDQVLYVTHSPFLINRNAGHRVRVVDKGARDEGTRVVKDATRNHYEPLRSSLGAFVAETAFIGGDNLFVEGIADQVLLAGMNARLLRAGGRPSECLDLNEVTIVPGGSSLPYMVYLARGRDQVKPACVVLVDGDQAGKTARKQLQRGGAHGRKVIADDLVLMVSDWANESSPTVTESVVVREPEDLVPVNVAVAACRRYARTFLGMDENESKKFTEADVVALLSEMKGSLWDSIEKAFYSVYSTGITKAGFAKELLAYLASSEGGTRPAGVPDLDNNFASLIRLLVDTLREAREQEADARRNQRLDRIINAFVADYPNGCTRDRASVTLRRVDAAADDSEAGDDIKAHTAKMRRKHKLASAPREKISDHQQFIEELRQIRLIPRLAFQSDPAQRTATPAQK